MFASLSSPEQSNRVLAALHDLLGDMPTKADDAALLTVTQNVLSLLHVAVRHMPAAIDLEGAQASFLP